MGLRGSRIAGAVDFDRRGRVTPAAWRGNGSSGRDLEPQHGGPDGLHVLRRIRGRQGAVVPAAPNRGLMGGIYWSAIPPIEYPWIYHERVIRSVANSTRQDGAGHAKATAVLRHLCTAEATGSRPVRSTNEFQRNRVLRALRETPTEPADNPMTNKLGAVWCRWDSSGSDGTKPPFPECLTSSSR